MKPFKKILCLLLICPVLLLAGCGDEEKTVEVTAAPTATPDLTPEPTPEPTPVPVVAIEDYQYYVVTNATLAVSFKYPTHWINKPAKSTICYVEPVDAGDTPARLAVASKVLSKPPEAKQLKKQLTDFMEIISGSCADYQEGEQKDKVAIMGVDGIRQKYTARDPETGLEITGYALICYVREARRVYLLHFTAPTGDYDELSAVIDVIRESMSTT